MRYFWWIVWACWEVHLWYIWGVHLSNFGCSMGHFWLVIWLCWLCSYLNHHLWYMPWRFRGLFISLSFPFKNNPNNGFFPIATKRSWYYSIYSYVSIFVSHFLSLHSLTHIHHTSTTHTQKQACPKLASAFFQLLIPLSFLFCFSEIYLAHPIFPSKKYWEERIGWDKYTSEKEEMSLFSFTCKEDPTYRPFCWCKRSKVNMNPEGEIHATWKRKNNSNINNIKHSSWCCFLSFSFLFPYRGN